MAKPSFLSTAGTFIRYGLLMLTVISGFAVRADPVPVELKRTSAGWQLYRGGEPFFIKGAGGKGSLEQLAAAGANSVRTWGAEDIGPLLDEAYALGLTVTVGIWLGHERHGFDYSDETQVKAQRERAREIVLRYRDHPAVLIWGIGNEMEGFESGDNPAIWTAVNAIAELVKELDPNHPTMTVTAEIGGMRIENINRYCPSIDIHGINTYGGALTLAERYRSKGGTRPYILTEFGPPGAWEIEKTAWGAAYELTSTDKAAFYKRSYRNAILDAPDLALGSYAFLWGHKMEATETWFGMFLPDGARLGAVDAMTELWSGSPPDNLAPDVRPLVIEGSAAVDPGDEIKVTGGINDPEGGRLKVRWVLRHDSSEYQTGGDRRPRLTDLDADFIEQDVDGARLRMPQAPGAYRLFLYAHDDAGNAATANVPLHVKGKALAPMPFTVYDDGFEGMPWIPSGWMGDYEKLSVDGWYTVNPFSGDACIKIRYAGNRGSWVGVVWQYPADNWGDKPGGHDMTGATALAFRARGRWGGERINAGVGLIGKNKAYPDSGKTGIEDIVLDDAWRRYTIPLEGIDLSSIKSGFYVSLAGRDSSVTVFLDDIRFIRE